MNPAEIYDALAELACKPYDLIEFPFDFALATDNAPATIAKLRGGTFNKSKSDLPGGVLMNQKFHFAPAITGMSVATIDATRARNESLRHRHCMPFGIDTKIATATHKSGNRFGFLLPAARSEHCPGREKILSTSRPTWQSSGSPRKLQKQRWQDTDCENGLT